MKEPITREDFENYFRDLEGAEENITPEACFGGDGGPHVPLAFTRVGGMFGANASVCRLCGSLFFNGRQLAKFVEDERRRVKERIAEFDVATAEQTARDERLKELFTRARPRLAAARRGGG